MHAHCASGCCGSHASWPCPCPEGGTPRLGDIEQLLSCYLQSQGGLAAEQAYYSGLASAHDALSEALLALTEQHGLRPDHAPLPESAATSLIEQLHPALNELLGCADFCALHALLHSTGLPLVAAYDTALRFGMHCGISPTRILGHPGNRIALGALGVAAPEGHWVDLQAFPPLLQALTAAEIELCLSLCRYQWQALSRANDEANQP